MRNDYQAALLAASLLLTPLLLTPVQAQENAGSSSGMATDYAHWSRQKLSEQGVYSLRYGRRLESAISFFAELEKREPQNARWKTLLACARVQRAYTLTRAMEDAKVYKTPEEHRKYWEDQRKKIFSMENSSLPDPPPVPRTRDDNQLFTQKPEAAAARIAQLSHEAIDLLEDATKLATKESPETQAELLHLKAWALLTLWRDPRRAVPDSWPKRDGKEEGPERIIAALEQAVKLQPENLVYQQSFSDGCILAASDPVRPASQPVVRFDEALYNRGRDALREFVLKRPRKAEYWFRLGYLEAREGVEGLRVKLFPNYASPDRAADAISPGAVSALERAAALDSSNPTYQYVLAAVRLSKGDRTGMIDAMERGNAAGPLLPLRYPYAAPPVFTWLFSEPDRPATQPVRLVANGVSDMRKDKDSSSPGSEFQRGMTALRGMDAKFKEALTNPGLSAEDKDIFLGHEISFSMTVFLYTPDEK